MKERGLTFIELILVLAVIGILSLMSFSFYSRFFRQNAAYVTQGALASQFRKAQIFSMVGKGDSSWGVNYASDQFTFFKGASYASRNSVYDEIFILNPSVSISGLGEVVFARTTGVPSSSGTITITSGSTIKTLTVNSQGVISK